MLQHAQHRLDQEEGKKMSSAAHIPAEQVIPYVFDLFESTCIKQFESINQIITRTEEPGTDPHTLSAHISAGNEDLKTTLLLSVPHSLLLKTLPAMQGIASIDDEIVEDWLLELCNRLQGRLKNKLLDHDCVLKMGLPKRCSEEPKNLLERLGGKCICDRFELAGEILEAYLVVELLNPKMMLSPYEDEDEDWFSEGELEHL
jgi:hypothetical protein